MTRVCYILPSLGVGGTEKQLLTLIRGLTKGHEVLVVCTRKDGALAGDIRRAGAAIRLLDTWTGWDPRMKSQIAHVLRAWRPDVMHTFLFGFDLQANRAARKEGVPVVISSRRQLATWKKGRHIRMQKKANCLVDCVVANCRAVAEFAINQEDADPSLFRVIYNGVDVGRFAHKADPHQLRLRWTIPFHTCVIGMVANFSPVKDHELFVATAERLAARRPDVHFLLVGNGPHRKYIESLVRRCGLEGRFSWISTFTELPDVLKLMDVSVLCSKAEGLPNAVLESMAAGIPVVAAAVGGVPEAIEDGHTGFLVGTRNPEDFAAGIERVLDRPDDARDMAERARQFVQNHFALDKMVAAYSELYAVLLAQSAGRGA